MRKRRTSWFSAQSAMVTSLFELENLQMNLCPNILMSVKGVGGDERELGGT
jgi:hypothetical protein